MAAQIEARAITGHKLISMKYRDESCDVQSWDMYVCASLWCLAIFRHESRRDFQLWRITWRLVWWMKTSETSLKTWMWNSRNIPNIGALTVRALNAIVDDYFQASYCVGCEYHYESPKRRKNSRRFCSKNNHRWAKQIPRAMRSSHQLWHNFHSAGLYSSGHDCGLLIFRRWLSKWLMTGLLTVLVSLC